MNVLNIHVYGFDNRNSPILQRLTLCISGKNFSSRQFDFFFLIFPIKKDLTFHAGDNLHEVSDPVF